MVTFLFSSLLQCLAKIFVNFWRQRWRDIRRERVKWHNRLSVCVPEAGKSHNSQSDEFSEHDFENGKKWVFLRFAFASQLFGLQVCRLSSMETWRLQMEATKTTSKFFRNERKITTKSLFSCIDLHIWWIVVNSLVLLLVFYGDLSW